MGCCLTTTAAVNHRQPPKPHPQPPPLPEETVKEVLSETPIIPKPPLTNRQLTNGEPVNATEQLTEKLTEKMTENVTVEVEENVSEVSEMYSYSESYSAATTATTMTTAAADGKKEEIEVEEGEVTQKVNNNNNKLPLEKRVVRKRAVGNSGEVMVRKERGVRPVARRHVAPSPERKRQSPGRGMTNTTRCRNVGPGNDGRKEAAARRSRSPAVRGESCQRRKVVEKSAVQKVGDVAPVAVSDGKSTVEKGGEAVAETVENGGETAETEVQGSESLENPLVSLECFIFL